LYLYARAAGVPLESVVPECMEKTADLARITESTVPGQDNIPICDGSIKAPMVHLAFMAYLLPESRWVDMYRKKLKESGGVFEDMFAMILDAKIPQQTEEKTGVVEMPDTGVTVVEWKAEAEQKKGKLLFMGAPADAGHQHEDKGNFILEYDGESFAYDPGTCNYNSPFSINYKTAQRHNMLIPIGAKERPAPLNPCPFDIKPRYEGDERNFTVDIDAGLAWPDYYEHWNRHFAANGLDCFSITDTWKLKEDSGATGVAFCWNSLLPMTIEEGRVKIQGKNSAVYISIPNDCRAEMIQLANYEENRMTNQVRLIKEEICGNMVVNVILA